MPSADPGWTQFDWTQFLGRTPAGIDLRAVGGRVEGKTIAITGAGGFIGSALARMLGSFSPAHMLLLDIAEHGLHALGTELDEAAAELVVGDVCDSALLRDLFRQHQPDIIFHAAAAKHVSLMERNPITAARSNVLGTRAVLDAANKWGAEQFVLVSTDKAVEPSSIMGATKRIAELLVLANDGPTQAKAVRLGNVLGSTGSVAPLFERQLARGGPLTITAPACTRYFLSIREVVDALLGALVLDYRAAILVACTGAPQRIVDLADYLVRGAGLDLRTVGIAYTGLGPGEKLSEAMLGRGETAVDLCLNQLQIVIANAPPAEQSSTIARIEAAVQSRSVHALLAAIAELLPAYQPSAALTAHAQATAPPA